MLMVSQMSNTGGCDVLDLLHIALSACLGLHRAEVWVWDFAWRNAVLSWVVDFKDVVKAKDHVSHERQ